MSSFSVQSMYDMDKLQSVIKVARRARCRGRFVAPVILYEGKVSFQKGYGNA